MISNAHGMHHKCKAYGLLALRLSAGIIFVIHGYGKLFGNMPGMDAFTGMVGKIGFPFPAFFAYVAALTEFVGGLLLIAGVGTQIVSVLLAIVMLVAWGMVKKFALPAGDADFALLAMMISLFCTGPGRFSVRGMMKKDGMTGCDCEMDKCPCADGKPVGKMEDKKM